MQLLLLWFVLQAKGVILAEMFFRRDNSLHENNTNMETVLVPQAEEMRV